MSRLLCCFFLLVAVHSWAQRYSFLTYGPDDGLPQSQVRCLASTDDGWLWVGTQQGLSRFDGQTFHPVTELGRTQINTLWKDDSGRLYVGYSGGFAVRNGRQFETWELRPEGRDAEVRQFGLGEGGELWIGTAAQGIWSWSGDTVVALPIQMNGLPLTDCRGILRLSDADWVADKHRILVRHRDGENGWREVSAMLSERAAYVNMFADERASNVWVATRGSGVLQFNRTGERLHRFDDTNGYLSNDARHFHEDSYGHIWISSRYGTARWDGNSFLNLTGENGLPTEQINCVTQDYEGNIWMGTQGKGLLLFNGTDVVSYTVDEGLTSNLVMNISADQSGDFWISTYDAGAARLDARGTIQDRFEVPGGNNRVWCSLKDSFGRMWFGTSNGLWCYDDGNWRDFQKEDGLNSRIILSLFEDDDGVIWVGSYRGINWISPEGTVAPFPHADTRVWKKVRCIRSDSSGRVWWAGTSGVFRLDQDEIRQWTDTSGLPDISCTSVLPSNSGVWVSTHEGLCRIRGEALDVFTGVGADEHQNFAVEWQEQLWVGTNNGLFHAPLPGLHSDSTHRPFQRLGPRDGLGSRETNQNAWWVDDRDRLWVGTTEGVSRLQPAVVERSRSGPPIVSVTEVRLNLLPADWGARGVLQDAETGLPVDLEVGYRDNHFTFHYRGFGMRYPDELQYQCWLEGFDETWRPVTSAEFATYSNLPFDAFVFHVRGRTGNGVWSDPVSFGFRVNPPFWLTWWFVVLEVLAVLALLWFILNRRKRMLVTRLEKEKFELKSKMLALEQQHLNSSMNRHFVFNALNSIQYYINRKDRIAANRYLTAFARLIRKNLDSSQDNLTSLRDEIERLELYLELEHMRFQDKFTYRIEVAPDVDTDGTQVPAMLLQPFLENSIWHGILPKNEPGEVAVFVSRLNGDIEFLIRDDGIGIETSRRLKQQSDQHISQGMVITSSRLEVMKKLTRGNLQLIGPYELKSEEGVVQGTEVRIILPQHFGDIFVN